MIPKPKCFTRDCVHYLGIEQPDGTEMTEHPVCKAFPNGIPKEIAYGNNLHINPFSGDNGIQYENAQ